VGKGERHLTPSKDAKGISEVGGQKSDIRRDSIRSVDLPVRASSSSVARPLLFGADQRSTLRGAYPFSRFSQFLLLPSLVES
jgi:hypothetical protein